MFSCNLYRTSDVFRYRGKKYREIDRETEAAKRNAER